VNVRLRFLALLVLTACGTAHGSASLPPPSPPTSALTAWKDFPANANPRPIIAFGDTTEYIQPAGFRDSDRKIAWICNNFVLGSGLQLSSTPPTSALATSLSGSDTSYPGIGSARAYSETMASRQVGGVQSDCTKLRPFVITAVRYATAGFQTDRGTMRMSAWLFDVPEVNGYIGHSAIDPRSFWGGKIVAGGGGIRGRISADGRTLKIPVGNAEPGPCGSDYTTATAESESAVAVAVKSISHGSPGDAVACPLVLHISYITVALKAPLGGRVLLDAEGRVGNVCPDTGDC
jgi:hypothetical protein